MINQGENVLGRNAHLSYIGGAQAVDRVQSQAEQEVVVNPEKAYSRQFDNRFTVDLTVTHRVNRKNILPYGPCK